LPQRSGIKPYRSHVRLWGKIGRHQLAPPRQLMTQRGPRRSDFAVTHKTAAHLLTSVASNVDIAEDARFKFQIIQPVLNHVTYADNAGQLAVAKHRHVAHAMAGHQVH
jgi:hypothetical protein